MHNTADQNDLRAQAQSMVDFHTPVFLILIDRECLAMWKIVRCLSCAHLLIAYFATFYNVHPFSITFAYMQHVCALSHQPTVSIH